MPKHIRISVSKVLSTGKEEVKEGVKPTGHTSMQPDGMHTREIRELASITQMLHHLEARMVSRQVS